MLEKDKTKKREERHSITQEDFTPKCVVDALLSNTTDFGITTTFLDNSCGIGNILIEILNRKLNNCKTDNDVFEAVKSIYGVELMADNVEDCRTGIYNAVISKYPNIEKNRLRSIIKNRIQWHDSLTFDYDNWPKLVINSKSKFIDFKIEPTEEDDKYPMWHKQKKQIIQLSLFDDWE